MAQSPAWKLYTPDGDYEAACKNIIVAAAVVSVLGEGATIRRGHRLILWTEGKDGWAGESYDDAAETALNRLNEWSNPPAK